MSDTTSAMGFRTDINQIKELHEIGPSSPEDATIENQITGSKIRFTRIPPSPNEGSLEFELTIAPGFVPAPGRGRLFEIDRSHPNQEMHLEVVEGVLCGTIRDQSTHSEKYAPFYVGGSGETPRTDPRPLQIREGQSINIGRGVGRRFWNGLENAETQVRVRLTPPVNTFDFIVEGYEKAWQRVEKPSSGTLNQDSGNQRPSTPTHIDSTESSAAPKRSSPSLLHSFRYGRKEMQWKSILVGGFNTAIFTFSYLLLLDSLPSIEDDLTPILGSGISREVANLLVNATPIALLIPVLGYLVQVSRSVLYGYTPLPQFENWRSLVKEGSKAAVIYLILLVYPLYAGVALFGVGGGVALQLFENVPSLNAVVTLAAWYVFPAAYMKFVETEQLRSLLNRRALLPILQQKSYFYSFIKFFIILFMLGFAYILGIAYGGVLIFLPWMLVGSIVLFYSVVSLAYYLANIWLVITSGPKQGIEPIKNVAMKVDSWFNRRESGSTVRGGRTERRTTDHSTHSSAVSKTELGLWEQLQQLQQLHEHSVLTDEEFERKRRKIVSGPKTTSERTHDLGSPRQLRTLDQMRDQGVFSDQEFEHVRRELRPGTALERSENTFIEKPEPDLAKQFDQLEQLYKHGLLTEEEFKKKQRQLEPDREETLAKLDSDTATQLESLRGLHESGVLSDEEFEQKQAKITHRAE